MKALLLITTVLTTSCGTCHQLYKSEEFKDYMPLYGYQGDPLFPDFAQPHVLSSRGDLRLVTDEGVATTAGRLEMYMGNENTEGSTGATEGSWGSVCGESFNLAAANVACRQLGFRGASGWNYTVFTPFGSANDSLPVAASQVKCPAGYQWHLMRCRLELEDLDCTHKQDVAVFCRNNMIWEEPYVGQVRLNNEGNHSVQSYGRVEVYQAGAWGSVCNKGFTQAGADSVCRQLGYTGAAYIGEALPGSGLIHVNELSCEESQACFSTCFKYRQLIHVCNHTMDTAVQCKFDLSEAAELPAGYSSSCSLNEFPLSLMILSILVGLGTVAMVGMIVVMIISLTRCCYKCRRKKKSYQELY